MKNELKRLEANVEAAAIIVDAFPNSDDAQRLYVSASERHTNALARMHMAAAATA